MTYHRLPRVPKKVEFLNIRSAKVMNLMNLRDPDMIDVSPETEDVVTFVGRHCS